MHASLVSYLIKGILLLKCMLKFWINLTNDQSDIELQFQTIPEMKMCLYRHWVQWRNSGMVFAWEGSLIELYSTSTPVFLHVVMFDKLTMTDLHIICEMFTGTKVMSLSYHEQFLIKPVYLLNNTAIYIVPVDA